MTITGTNTAKTRAFLSQGDPGTRNRCPLDWTKFKKNQSMEPYPVKTVSRASLPTIDTSRRVAFLGGILGDPDSFNMEEEGGGE